MKDWIRWLWYRIRGYTPIAKSEPLYEKPKMSLLDKANFHEDVICNYCIDPQTGLMLYKRMYFKDHNFGMYPDGHEKRKAAHNMADFPAWQPKFIIGLAFKQAMTKDKNIDRRILKLLQGISNCFKANGVPGVLCRSYIKYDSDEPLPWMTSYEQNKKEDDLKDGWWEKGKNGYWYRGQCAPNHYQSIWTMCCILGSLFDQRLIYLSKESQDTIKYIITSIYNKIENEGSGDIIGVDGKTTGYGHMRVWEVNPQYALWHLTRHKAASVWDIPGAENKFLHCLEDWEFALADTYDIIVPILKRIPLSVRPLDANDIQSQHFAWLGLLMTCPHYLIEDIREGFEKLYQLHDPFNIANYIIQRIGRPGWTDKVAHKYFLKSMEWYRENKFNYKNYTIEHTDKFQPIENRKITSSYSKTSAGDKVISIGDGSRDLIWQCGFDYVWVYWLARYFNIIDEQESSNGNL